MGALASFLAILEKHVLPNPRKEIVKSFLGETILGHFEAAWGGGGHFYAYPTPAPRRG